EGSALVVAPELRTGVELGEVDQRLLEAMRLPVLGAARQVLRNVEAKGRRQLLLLDGGDVEVRGRLDSSLGQLDTVVDRLHPAAAEHLATQELSRLDRGRELPEQRLAVQAQAEEQVGHEERYEPGEGTPEVGRHDFEVRIARPAGIGRFDQRRSQRATENG